jgi:hypothetical protein
VSIARHYIEEPPEGEPPFGYCPRCDYALVDEHECRCGWNEYEAVAVASPSSLRVNGREESEVRVADPTTATLYADHRRRGGKG